MTRDQECVAFLQWALPRLGLRWAGFRKVRRQVCRRVRRRAGAVGRGDLAGYRQLLETEPGEWARLEALCRVTISRFHRDRALWERLAEEVLPDLLPRAARRDPPRLAAWSAGCGAGEEPFTLALLLELGPHPRPAGVAATIVATDLDLHQLARARRRRFPAASLRDLPDGWRRRAFVELEDGSLELEARFAEPVRFVLQDLRRDAPAGAFDLVFCRNLVFTYWDRAGQERGLERLLAALAPGGWLIVGHRETPPGDPPGLSACGAAGLYRAARESE